MAGKQVIIRTLDIGADKQLDDFNLQPRESGTGIPCDRIRLKQPDIFKTSESSFPCSCIR